MKKKISGQWINICSIRSGKNPIYWLCKIRIWQSLPKIELHDLYFSPSWSNVIAESKLKICIEPLTFRIDFKVNCDIGTCWKPSTVLYSQNFHNNLSQQFRFDCKQKKAHTPEHFKQSAFVIRYWTEKFL